MNTVQQPAADVATSLLTPKKYYQRASGLRSFSNALVTVLTPVLATALLAFTDIQAVIWMGQQTMWVCHPAVFCKNPRAAEGRAAAGNGFTVGKKRALLPAAQPGDSGFNPVFSRHQSDGLRL